MNQQYLPNTIYFHKALKAYKYKEELYSLKKYRLSEDL